MGELKELLITAIDRIKEEEVAVRDPTPGPTIAWRIRSAFLDAGVVIDDSLEDVFIEIVNLCGYPEAYLKTDATKNTATNINDTCEYCLNRLLRKHLTG